MFAVIEQGGKQHRVEVGSTIIVDRIPSEQKKKFSNKNVLLIVDEKNDCLLYTSPSPRDLYRSRMPSSA